MKSAKKREAEEAAKKAEAEVQRLTAELAKARTKEPSDRDEDWAMSGARGARGARSARGTDLAA